jgi:hypothetical protein
VKHRALALNSDEAPVAVMDDQVMATSGRNRPEDALAGSDQRDGDLKFGEIAEARRIPHSRADTVAA